MRFKYIIFFSLIFCCFSTLTSCSRHVSTLNVPAICMPADTLPEHMEALCWDITGDGVQMIHQGDMVRIIMYVDYFFDLYTTEFLPYRMATMRKVAKFVNCYTACFRHPKIFVDGYTDCVFGRNQHRVVLSQQYANTIAYYLWSAGIDRYYMSVMGHGGSEPIAGYKDPSNPSFNRRVEIRINPRV